MVMQGTAVITNETGQFLMNATSQSIYTLPGVEAYYDYQLLSGAACATVTFATEDLSTAVAWVLVEASDYPVSGLHNVLRC